MKNPIQIAIDGPVGAGKSEISRALAARLGILYLYTGVMYRAVAFECMQKGIDISDIASVTEIARSIPIELLPTTLSERYPVRVELNRYDVTEQLFTSEVEKFTPVVASYENVRTEMVKRQQEIAKGQNVVAEGRDIGLRVFPGAQLKIFLTATLEERARRRYAMALKKGTAATLTAVMEDTKKRDDLDMNRRVDPLQILPDAWVLDTTGMTQEEVLNAIITKLTELKLI